ncbi:MAG: flagellar protein FliS, partial [Spirochaetaceae bacterium]|nr:flagellar protein FliS [Spirochaetaceae bacterium]
MAYASVSSAYRETKIKTASQGQLIIMLYDAAIKQLDTSLELLKPARGGPSGSGRGGSPGNRSARGSPARAAGNGSPAPEKIEKIGKAILKAQEIITELMVSLDFEAGGE